MITAISWARESNQYDKNEYTLDAQIEANQRNAERDGLTISHTFREKFSGVDLWAMPELTRLRSLLQATPGKKVVYVYAQDGQEIPFLPEPPKSALSVGTRVIDRELRGDWVVRSIDTRTNPALVCCEPSRGTAQEKGNTLAETFRADELTICD